MASTMREPAIRMHGIHKSFGANEVLRGIDIEARRGETLSIIGPSGSGKSTLLRCINRLEDIDKGSIEIDGDFLAAENGAGHSAYVSGEKCLEDGHGVPAVQSFSAHDGAAESSGSADAGQRDEA